VLPSAFIIASVGSTLSYFAPVIVFFNVSIFTVSPVVPAFVSASPYCV